MKTVLGKLNKEHNKTIIICGDFNLNLLNFENDVNAGSFLNIMLENNFLPVILEPTRVTNLN